MVCLAPRDDCDDFWEWQCRMKSWCGYNQPIGKCHSCPVTDRLVHYEAESLSDS